MFEGLSLKMTCLVGLPILYIYGYLYPANRYIVYNADRHRILSLKTNLYMDMQGKTKEELFKELKELQKEHDALKISYERDVNERMKVEKELLIGQQRLANILEGTNVGTWEWNVQTGETVFNEKWAEIIGYSLEEISPTTIGTWMQFAHPDDLQKSQGLLEEHFQGKTDYYECETRMKHKNGNWIWVLDRGKVMSWTEDNKPLLMLGTHQDITDRKQSQLEFNTLLSTTMDGFFITNEKGRIIEANDAFCQRLGYTRQEMLKMSIPDFEGAENSQEVKKHMNKVFE